MKDDVRKTTNIVDILSDGSRKIVSRPAVLFFTGGGNDQSQVTFQVLITHAKKWEGGGGRGGGGESIHGRAWGA